MLQRAFLVAVACAFVCPLVVPSVAFAGKAADAKPKPTKASVQAKLAKLTKARDDIRVLSAEAAPTGLSADQKKTYTAEMATLVSVAAATDTVTKDLEAGLKEAAPKLDSLSEMGEMESLRLQAAMDRLSKLFATLSNLLKKQSDTANGIVQNLK